MLLTTEQIRFFKREGYLIVRDILDAGLMRRALDCFWSAAPADLRRDDPVTWPGTFAEPDGSGDWRDDREGTIWRYRTPGAEGWMLKLLPQHPPVRAIAEQLLGTGSLAPARRARGIYCTRPEAEYLRAPRRCHVDEHPFHLGVVAYIDDVPPQGGGFAVWPGSHRRFFHRFYSRYLFAPTRDYEPLIVETNRQAPADCHGGAGDVVFFHHRLAHKAGHNELTGLRLAVPYDFAKANLLGKRLSGAPGRASIFAARKLTTSLPHTRAVGQLLFGGKLFEPPGDDMWRDWSLEVRTEGSH